MNVLITGGTGFIGKEIGKSLIAKGYRVTVLSRSRDKAKRDCPFPCEVIEGDLSVKPLAEKDVDSIDAVIHLMGENVGEGRWNTSRKQAIMQSRQNSSKNLIQTFRSSSRLKVIVSSSAIGFYGDRGDEELSENSPKGHGFLAEVCEEWERPFRDLTSTRTVQIRTGLVLGAFGGALPKMIKPFQLGLGGSLGSGNQWQSWIHIEDLVRIYMLALEHEKLTGPVNAVSPHSLPQKEFAQCLAHNLNVSLGPTAPSVALKALMGEMSHLVLDSQKVNPTKLKNLGFSYLFAEINHALKDTCAYYQNGDSVFFSQQYFDEKKEQIFPFFSEANNLEKITPPMLNFNIESVSTSALQKGTLIHLRLKIHGFPVKWQTLINVWDPPIRFADTQLKGPYKKWHHIHEFSDLGPGTLMKDIVRYKLPAGKVGSLLGGLLIENDIKKIFDYRKVTLSNQIF